MKLNCLVVDDEPIARKIICEFIDKVSYLHLCGEAEDPIEANPLLKDNSIDILFLDIQMPRMSGLSFLKSLNHPSFLTIITTAYPNHAVDGFELNILDYLVKPVSEERFLKACAKAKQYFDLTRGLMRENFFFVKSEGRIERVEYDNLIYVESLGNYVTLFLTGRKIVTYLTLKSMLEQLPADQFIQVHKSYLINLKKITSIEGNEIKFGSLSVPIGQKMKDEVMSIILSNRFLKR